MIIPATVLTVLTVVLLAVAALCASGAIRRNHLVGIRFPVLFVSDDAWRSGHRAAIAPAAVGSVVAIAAVVLAYTVRSLEPWTSLVAILAAVGAFAWSITAALRTASGAS